MCLINERSRSPVHKYVILKPLTLLMMQEDADLLCGLLILGINNTLLNA